MGIHWAALLLLALALWTATGVLGVLLATRRGEQQRALRGARALVVVWAIYLVLLVAISRQQGERTLQPGYSQCFGSVCYRVERAEELQGFWVRGQQRERLVRVAIRLTSQRATGSTREAGLRAILIDAQGHRWPEVPGLTGVRLSAALPARGSAVSEPVFRVPADATGLRLQLAHTSWTSNRLLLGDAESLWHRPTFLLLPGSEHAASPSVAVLSAANAPNGTR